MQEKIYYITEDGCKFENAIDAQEHESRITKEKENRNRIVKLDNGKELNRDDIIEFFNKVRCNECPFDKECEKLFHGFLTDTICSAIKGKKPIEI